MKRALAWRIFDEVSGEYWHDPGEILPKTYPSHAAAMSALSHIRAAIRKELAVNYTYNMGHRPEPVIRAMWIEKEEFSAFQKIAHARQVA